MAPNRILSVTASIDTIGEILLKIIPTLEEVSQNKEGKVMKFFTADIDSYVLLIVMAVHQMSFKLLTIVLIIHNAKYVNGQHCVHGVNSKQNFLHSCLLFFLSSF